MWLINIYLDDFSKKNTAPTFSLATGNLLIDMAKPDKMEYKCLTLYFKINVTHLIYLSNMAITQISPINYHTRYYSRTFLQNTLYG